MVSQTTSDRGGPQQLVRYCRKVYTFRSPSRAPRVRAESDPLLALFFVLPAPNRVMESGTVPERIRQVRALFTPRPLTQNLLWIASPANLPLGKMAYICSVIARLVSRGRAQHEKSFL